MVVYSDDPNNLRHIQLGVIHGAVRPCENDFYPSIYTRLNAPKILKWIKKEVFNQGEIQYLYQLSDDMIRLWNCKYSTLLSFG